MERLVRNTSMRASGISTQQPECSLDDRRGVGGRVRRGSTLILGYECQTANLFSHAFSFSRPDSGGQRYVGKLIITIESLSTGGCSPLLATRRERFDRQSVSCAGRVRGEARRQLHSRSLRSLLGLATRRSASGPSLPYQRQLSARPLTRHSHCARMSTSPRAERGEVEDTTPRFAEGNAAARGEGASRSTDPATQRKSPPPRAGKGFYFLSV